MNTLPRQIDLFTHIELLAKIIEHARGSLDDHAEHCERHPHLVLLNPANFEMLRLEELLGLPVLPDESVEPMMCRMVCGQSGVAGLLDGRKVVWSDGEPYVLDPNYVRESGSNSS